VLDAVHFEQQGVPAAAILTEPFAATGEAIAELQGFADYPFATVPHPIGSLTKDQAMAAADAVTPTVLNLLTTSTHPARADQPTNEDELTGAAPADVVEELAAVLRADRADLTATVAGRHITLSLHIPDEACAQCVLPATMLTSMFQQRFDTELGPGWAITLDDPRETDAAVQ
jgi:hypothetical protein